MKLEEILNTVIQGDCLEIMKGIKDFSEVVIITDPPYPDYLAEEYGYKEGIIDFLKDIPCEQLVFWSAKVDFPLDYSAIHIWDKLLGVGSMYERIFERNGGQNYRVFRSNPNSNKVSAQMNNEDLFSGHPSQKPLKLICKLVEEYSTEDSIILDPFAGSGSTLVAAKRLNRQFIGIEKNPEYCKIANDRLRQDILI